MMEQLYNDFVTKMLPTIQEGLMITKDYFVDLFGRYITYLIATDIIKITTCLFVFGFAIYMVRWLYKGKWVASLDNYTGDRTIVRVVGTLVGGAIIIGSFLTCLHHLHQLAKVVFVPEIRVYEELSTMFNKPNTTPQE